MTSVTKIIQAAAMAGSLLALGSLGAWVAEPFVNLNSSAVSVTTSSTEVLGANAARGYALANSGNSVV